MRLSRQVILVTGSTSGIGEAIARRFARDGAAVLVHGLDIAAGLRIAADIAREGGETEFISGRLEDPAAPQRIVAAAIARWGRIDGVVNNAADLSRSSLESTDATVFDRVIAVNLRAPLLLIREALPHFRRQGGGRVLNIGSTNSYCGERNLLAYSISKAGLVTLTRNLADAHGSEGVRCNLLNVGWTLTANERQLKIAEGMPDDWPQRLPRSLVPSGRLLAPEEIAAAAAYFFSEEAALINGATIDLEQYPVVGRNPAKETA